MNTILTRSEAVRLGLVSPTDGCLEEERKYPYVRMTHPYCLDELWMAGRAADTLKGSDFILIIDAGQIALFRARGELKDLDSDDGRVSGTDEAAAKVVLPEMNGNGRLQEHSVHIHGWQERIDFLTL